MPINSNQLNVLHQKIMKNESIDSLLAEIDPDDLLATLNYTLSYITRDLSNSDCLSAVHLAAKHGNLPALQSLSRAGADFTLTTDNYGENALHFAADFNHPHIVDYLIVEKGTPVDIPTVATRYYSGNNTSPLFKCAVHSCLEAAERLIAHGANVNYEDSEGKNPLSYAANYARGWNSKEVIAQMDHYLLQNGAVDKALLAIPEIENHLRTATARQEPYINLLESLKKRELNATALQAMPTIADYISGVSDCNKYKAGFKLILELLRNGVYDSESYDAIPLLEEFLEAQVYFDKLYGSMLTSLNKRAIEVAAYTKKTAPIDTPTIVDTPQPASSSASNNNIPALTSNGIFAANKKVDEVLIHNLNLKSAL